MTDEQLNQAETNDIIVAELRARVDILTAQLADAIDRLIAIEALLSTGLKP